MSLDVHYQAVLECVSRDAAIGEFRHCRVPFSDEIMTDEEEIEQHEEEMLAALLSMMVLDDDELC